MRYLNFEQRRRFQIDITNAEWVDQVEPLLERIEKAVVAAVLERQASEAKMKARYIEQPSSGLPFYDTTPDENWGYGTT